MKRIVRIQLAGTLTLYLALPARADIIMDHVPLVKSAIGGQNILVDHPPHPYGGPDSDTSFRLFSGQPYWQRVIDDFALARADQAIAVTYWGFYSADNPPATETMRIRVLGSRAGDLLPDENNVLSETLVMNPSRAWTGRFIGTGILPKEYRYEIGLASVVSLAANTKYWLEVAQIGDIDTAFRWESSVADLTGHAFINPATGGDWQHTNSAVTVDLAFQLISPEPTSVALWLSGVLFIGRRRRCRTEAEWKQLSRCVYLVDV